MRKLTLFLLAFIGTAIAQGPRIEFSNTKESLRGVSAVSRQIAWASGTHGTYLRTTDAGVTWTPAQVADAANLDFRAVVAFSADEAFLMSAGPGDQSRIYHTADAGQHWDLQFTNSNPKGFFDSMVFWDPKHGIVLGDPIPDENGKLKFELLMTDDGKTWHQIPPQQLPPAMEGEGAFAASNTCIAILRNPAVALAGTPPSNNIVIPNNIVTPNKLVVPNNIVTPNKLVAPNKLVISNNVVMPNKLVISNNVVMPNKLVISNNIVISNNVVAPNKIVIPSEARNLLYAGATPAAGGPTQPPAAWESGPSGPPQPAENEGALAPDPNLWFATGGKSARVFHSPDGGKTWDVIDTPIQHGPDSAGIFSIAFRDSTHGVIAGGDYKRPNDDGPNLAFTEDGGKTWNLWSIHPQAYFSAVAYDQRVNAEAIAQASKLNPKPRFAPTLPERIFIAAPDFIFDFRPPLNPRRINGKKKQNITFNAVSAFPEGGALSVGPKGSIAFIP